MKRWLKQELERRRSVCWKMEGSKRRGWRVWWKVAGGKLGIGVAANQLTSGLGVAPAKSPPIEMPQPQERRVTRDRGQGIVKGISIRTSRH